MTPPLPMQCSYPGCDYSTPTSIPTYEYLLKALELHVNSAHTVSRSTDHANNPKVEKPKRPQVQANMSESDWVFFEHKWARYQRQSKITGQQVIDELWACLDVDLERLAFQDGISESEPDKLIAAIKSLAVTTVHPALHVVALHDTKQLQDETVKSFSARVRGLAKNCNLTKNCPKTTCGENVSFIEETCYHVVLAGIHDETLKEKILTQAMMGSVTNLSSLLEYAAAEEGAKQKTPIRTVAALTQKPPLRIPTGQKCMGCNQPLHGPQNKRRSKDCKAFGKKCDKCGKMNHYSNLCKSKAVAGISPVEDSETLVDSEEVMVSGFITGILPTMVLDSPNSALQAVNGMRSSMAHNINSLPIPHYEFDKLRKIWSKQPPKPSPTITVSVSIDRQAYRDLQLNLPDLVKKSGAGHARARTGTLDTGAQLTVINSEELHALGIKVNSIFPLAMTVNTVTKSAIDLLGGVFLRFTAYDPKTSTTRYTRQLCYVSKSVKGIYLSETACIDLGYAPTSYQNTAEISATTGPCKNYGVGPVTSCSCPRRSLPPSTPPELPCKPLKENLPILKDYILNRYSASAFNICEKQTLPLMDKTPPLRLFVDSQATPTAVMTPATIPLHWEQDVKDGLDRDVALGVIEKVDVNVPVQWCSRMLVAPKSDGTPRRVIDFTPVNKHAPRQVHHTRSPYVIATSVPSNQVKTVLDNWHGYHSVPIHPDDTHLTTFITPYGRYKYKTAPQGFISAGDGYTHRMDIIVQGTEKFDHCVDDSILWNSDIESNFFQVCEFLEKCANAGCTFNPSKFQFAQEEVNFLGFKITNTGLGPTDAFVENIRSFPSPKNLTDVRAWFGTINQVSYSFAIAEKMAPFRKLLSSKLPFLWSPELESAFQASKTEIIEKCALGVRKFEPQRITALATDWSRLAVGCWLTQKFCECPSEIPGCCSTGWQTVHVSSKFNSPAVSRYHPIEGEAFAAAWALEKCKLFVLGNPKLKLAVDHKPLIAILGTNQDLTEVMNPRLLNFKLKSMAFKFKPIHVPGKKHVVPDAFSRRHDSPINFLEKLPVEPPVSNNVTDDYENTFGPPSWISSPTVSGCHNEQFVEALYTAQSVSSLSAIASTDPDAGQPALTWQKLEQLCQECPEYVKLFNALQNPHQELPQVLQSYKKLMSEFTTIGPVIMLQKRVLIPKSARSIVLNHLHSCHAGAQAMIARAVQSVYWPGFRQDIENTRRRCTSCNLYAPSNPAMPLISEPDIPEFPFQIICSDFMEWQGHTYLVIVDKYSNWVSLFKLQKDDSKHLIQTLRMYFSTFGVAQVLCTDGAKVYTSAEMNKFYSLWGITHRVSSAYHPAANKRAEVGVKSAKRIIRENVGPNGTLNTNKVTQALLAHRNCPDPTTQVSPSQIVFGRSIRDIIPQKSYTPDRAWRDMAKARESSFLRRHYLKSENDVHGKLLTPLSLGDSVYIQDQAGKTPKRWSKSGIVVEVLPFDAYMIKVDGSNNLTKRNRRFLKKFTPFSDTIKPPSPSPDSEPRRSLRLADKSPVPTSLNQYQEVPVMSSLTTHPLEDSPMVVFLASTALDLTAPTNLRPPGFSASWGASGTPQE